MTELTSYTIFSLLFIIATILRYISKFKIGIADFILFIASAIFLTTLGTAGPYAAILIFIPIALIGAFFVKITMSAEEKAYYKENYINNPEMRKRFLPMIIASLIFTTLYSHLILGQSLRNKENFSQGFERIIEGQVTDTSSQYYGYIVYPVKGSHETENMFAEIPPNETLKNGSAKFQPKTILDQDGLYNHIMNWISDQRKIGAYITQNNTTFPAIISVKDWENIKNNGYTAENFKGTLDKKPNSYKEYDKIQNKIDSGSAL